MASPDRSVGGPTANIGRPGPVVWKRQVRGFQIGFQNSGQGRINVTIRTREIYHSTNGDRWLLALDSDADRVFVRHEPNLPSGRQVVDIEIGAFLIAAGNGPEKQELVV